MTIKTSGRGNNRQRRADRQGGYALFSMVIGIIIAALAFATVAGSIALLVKGAASQKTELFTGIERRNAQAADMETEFASE